jgi:predicted metal-binding membrane protein
MGSSERPPDPTSRLLRHERLIVAGSIALLVALSWWFLVNGAGMGDGMGMAAMPPRLGALVLMWWLMMVAMMLPSAAPAILLYARVRAQRHASGPIVQPWIFLLGYLAIWLLFSIAAAAAQHLAAGGVMALDDSRLEGAVLIGAGLYQLSPLKSACLRQCRSPVQFLTRNWRAGASGAVRLGVLHGAYCVGCCWMLMALLFVGGVMNFAWIAALTLLVGIEKLVPGGEWVGRAAGVGLMAWGAMRFLG